MDDNLTRNKLFKTYFMNYEICIYKYMNCQGKKYYLSEFWNKSTFRAIYECISEQEALDEAHEWIKLHVISEVMEL
jgi:hypothetical protein